MAEQIVPPAFDLASSLDDEAYKLNTIVGMMYDALNMCDAHNQEQTNRAQDRMLFLTHSIADMQKRLESMTAAAYELPPMK